MRVRSCEGILLNTFQLILIHSALAVVQRTKSKVQLNRGLFLIFVDATSTRNRSGMIRLRATATPTESRSSGSGLTVKSILRVTVDIDCYY